jgi:3-methyladenine DNA glycosylase AlkC
MKRVDAIADALGAVLPPDAEEAQRVMRPALGEPLGPEDRTFNDGYWTLPLARFWTCHHIDTLSVSLGALEELTQRGTAEFAIRGFVERYPEEITPWIDRWTRHESFHVRRLASEGTRLYLPWGGRLKVPAKRSAQYFALIARMAGDESKYVRRSVGNHARDLRKVTPEVVERWEADAAVPADVARFAAARG